MLGNQVVVLGVVEDVTALQRGRELPAKATTVAHTLLMMRLAPAVAEQGV
jgi:hypothetical protein